MTSTDQQQDDLSAIWIDGQAYTFDDLTYREQRKVRDLLKGIAPDVEDTDDASLADFMPCVITVIKQRTDPDFTIDQALDFSPKELRAPERPTKKAAARKS